MNATAATLSASLVVILLLLTLAIVSNADSSTLSDCTRKPCANNGTCEDQPGTLYGYRCECINGWKGTDCSVEPNRHNQLISGGGRGGAQRSTNSSHKGESSKKHDTRNNDTDSGDSRSDEEPKPISNLVLLCLNGGRISPTNNSACLCSANFTGARCESAVAEHALDIDVMLHLLDRLAQHVINVATEYFAEKSVGWIVTLCVGVLFSFMFMLFIVAGFVYLIKHCRHMRKRVRSIRKNFSEVCEMEIPLASNSENKSNTIKSSIKNATNNNNCEASIPDSSYRAPKLRRCDQIV